jgi:thiamine monophosphate synthase
MVGLPAFIQSVITGLMLGDSWLQLREKRKKKKEKTQG